MDAVARAVRRKAGRMTDTEIRRREAICKVAGVSEIDDLSDGFHTFRQLYYQRMVLFAAIVRQNKDKAWKSLRHEDGELCFGGGWFIVGIDTPEGSYTYHYEDSYFSLFDCEELECGKRWDGHTEKDVTRLLSLPSAQPDAPDIYVGDMIYRQAAVDAIDALHDKPNAWLDSAVDAVMALPSAQPEPSDAVYRLYKRAYEAGQRNAQPELHFDEWCTDCKEYDKERHRCPRWNRVIRETLKDAQPEIVRCKDCKHYQFADNRAFGMPVKMCEWFGFEDVDDDDFCSRAERREK